jgi:hypothetical protein
MKFLWIVLGIGHRRADTRAVVMPLAAAGPRNSR